MRFVFSVFEVKPRETLRSRGNKPRCFPRDQSRSVFLYASQLPTRKICEEIVWLTNLPRFQGAQPDHVRVESSCCCFPRELRRRNTRYKNPQPVAQHCFVARFGRCFPFFTLLDQLDLQQKHLLRVEEMQRADWLICRARANLLRDKL